MKIKKWIKKRKWDIVFVVFVGLLFIPSIRTPIQVFIQQLFSGAPTEIAPEKQTQVQSLNWKLQDLDGKSANLSEVKDKVVIINLWATWCPPCKAEMPALQQLYTKYGERVAFFFVSNEKPDKLTSFLQQEEYDLPVYIPRENYPKEFSSTSLPTTYVIDKEGNIIMEEIGAKDWFSESFQKRLEELIEG